MPVKGVSLDQGSPAAGRRGEWERPAGAYEALPERRVLVLAYGCSAGKIGRTAYGAEHTALGSFGVDALGGIDPPARYA
jgi:hypothetical protein